jgi:hypothetical protein
LNQLLVEHQTHRLLLILLLPTLKSLREVAECRRLMDNLVSWLIL